MTKLHTERYLGGRTVLLFFIITSCIYLFMLLVTIPKVMTFSSGMALLDMLPTGYSHEYVMKLFGALGTDGRDAYLTTQIPVDMIYPGMFAFTYALVFRYFIKKTGNLSSHWNLVAYLPIIAGACDYIENFFFINMLITYPDVTESIVSVAAIFSVTKSLSTTLYFVGLIVLLIYFGVRTIQLNRRSHSKV